MNDKLIVTALLVFEALAGQRSFAGPTEPMRPLFETEMIYKNPEIIASISAGDFDGDGLEEFAAMGGGSIAIYKNSGKATFSITNTIAISPPSIIGGVSTDLNGDGRPDLLVVSQDSLQKKFFVLLNDQNEDFNITSYDLNVAATNFFVSDLDNDGDIDLGILAGIQTYTYNNDGTGIFSLSPSTLFDNQSIEDRNNDLISPKDFANFDADQDGDFDLAKSFYSQGNFHTLSVAFNGGNGNYLTQSQIPSATIVYASHAFDMDSDGDVDIVTAGERLEIFENQGMGNYTSLLSIPNNRFSGPIFSYDSNHDGSLDLLWPTSQQLLLQSISVGLREFSIPMGKYISTIGGYASNPAMGELLLQEGTAIPKYYVVGSPSTVINIFSFNQEGLLYRKSSQEIGKKILFLDFSDVDFDGDFDIGFISDDNQIYLSLNDGDDIFQTPTLLFAGGSDFKQIYLCDISGDNHMDMIVCKKTGVDIYRNDGAENFTLFKTVPALQSAGRVLSLDVDQDGFLDIVFTDNGILLGLLRNLNNLDFADPEFYFVYSTYTTQLQPGGAMIEASDIDVDGDTDLLFSGPTGSAILKNSHLEMKKETE